MSENVEKLKNNNNDYYMKSVKFVRDLVLGYIYLTKFDLTIIDTLEFQRLKDIRQLTCQQVFPAARHTRFEHSLGVMELTRRALKNLNRNRFLSSASSNCDDTVDQLNEDSISSDQKKELSSDKKIIFNSHMQFNAALAALLHDVGHCPFSHLGEAEMSRKEIWQKLYQSLNNCNEMKGSSLLQKFQETFSKLESKFINDNLSKEDLKGFGSKHEQLSCIVVLDKFYDKYMNFGSNEEQFDDKSPKKVDIELIIRSILGIQYDISNSGDPEENMKKNVIVNLINSKVFDLDKLDYVMRDSWFTGIGAPQIDTHRLFRNMYLNNKKEYNLVFMNRAVPSLQNLIESRDELYMYVYNHHTSVYSDYMFSYIFRRLTHSVEDLSSIKESSNCSISYYDNRTSFYLGLVPKDYLFSSEAVLNRNCSDSNLTYLLNSIREDISNKSIDDIKDKLYKMLPISMEDEGCKKQYDDTISKVSENIIRTYNLIEKYQKREFLKPWWKTSSEFNNFIKTNFLDDPIREKLCNWICHGEGALKSDEFCSQLAKNVSYITRHLTEEEKKECGLIKHFEKDEFFVIRRSSHFFDPKTIGQLDIALKRNEMLGSTKEVKYYSGDFYIKSLTNVIPQRDYYSMYAENSFYVFSKPLDEEIDENLEHNNGKRRKHYQFIEKIFVFVATTLIEEGVSRFQKNYGNKNADAEKNAHENMLKLFRDTKI